MISFDPNTQGDTFDPSTIAWVFTEDQVGPLLAAIAGAERIVIDLETTGLNERQLKTKAWPVAARVSMASLTLPQLGIDHGLHPPTYVVPLSHPQGPWVGQWRFLFARIMLAIQTSGRPVSNQNMKFDSRWGEATTTVDVSDQIAWDTQVSSHLLDENASTSLKTRAPETFGMDSWKDNDLSTPGASERVPLFELGVYAARDTYWTWRLEVLHQYRLNCGPDADPDPMPDTPDEVEDLRLGSLAKWCAMPMLASLTEIEQRGMRLDIDWVHNKLAELQSEHDSAYAPLVDRYALGSDRKPSFAATSHWFKDFAAAAVAAGDLQITAMTANGNPQWNKSVLTRQANHGSEVAALLLQVRGAVKLSEFLNSWRACVDPQGRVHSTYHAGRVVTGRLSSADPNMQQITHALKAAWIASPGYVIGELDHSQIELRIGAFVSRCEPMLQAFRDRRDLHLIMGSQITGKPEGEVSKDERQGGKAGNFGFLYGMGAAGFRDYALDTYDVEFSDDEAVAVRSAFFATWSGIASWHERAVTYAHQTGQVVSPIGRVRRLPDLFDGNPARAGHAERAAINSPVQSFASDIMQIGAAMVTGKMPGYDRLIGTNLVATVHDSIVGEIREDDWERQTHRTMERLLDVHPVLAKMGCTLDVPLSLEAKVGTRWGSADLGVIEL